MANVSYPLDTTGMAPTNLIVDEIHTLTEINSSTYRILIPEFAPFYLDNFQIKHIDGQGVIKPLIEGVDFHFCLPYIGATRSIAKVVYGGISINTLLANGTIKITYQTIGGDWTADASYVLARIAELVYNPRTTVWDNVTNKQTTFPPINHDQSLDYIYGHGDLIATLNSLAETIAIGPNPTTGLVRHLIDENNPHSVTKQQIGLGSVDDTSDLSKPISNATQTALGDKADKATLAGSSGAAQIGFMPDGDGAVLRDLEDKNRERLTPGDYFTPGELNDTVSLQKCINHALEIGAEVDLLGKTYSVSAQIGVNGNNGISVKNGRLLVTGGAWSSGLFGAVLNIQRPVIAPSGKRHRFNDVFIDCNNIARSAFYIYRVSANTVFDTCAAVNYSDYGFWIKGTGDGNNDIKFICCSANEILFGAEPKSSDYSVRTGTGFFIDSSADVNLFYCTAAMNKYNLRCYNYWNGSFTGCVFWSGLVRTDPNSVTVLIESTCHNLQFSNCRFDDGAVMLYSFDHSFNGCKFIQFDHWQLQLVATVAGETASKLVFVGNTLNGSKTSAQLLTEGVGTWGVIDGQWVGNVNGNKVPFSIQGKSFIVNGLVYTTSGSLYINSDAYYSTRYGMVPKVQVSNEIGNGGFGVFCWGTAGKYGTYDILTSNSGVQGVFAQTLDNTVLGSYSFSGVDDLLVPVPAAEIKAIATSDFTSSNKRAKLSFELMNGTATKVAAVLDSSGNLIINSPDNYTTGFSIIPKLQVHTDLSNGMGVFSWVAAGNAVFDLFTSNSGTIGTYSQTLNGVTLGVYSFSGVDGALNPARAAAIKAIATGNFIASNKSAKLSFEISNGSTTPVPAMELLDNGDLDLLLGGLKVNGTKVIGPRETGWTESTGIANKDAYTTYPGQTIDVAYSQTQLQDLDNALRDATQRIKALEDLLRGHGLMD